MVALHRQTGDTGYTQAFKSGNGMDERARIDGPFLKEIAGQQNEVDFLFDGPVYDVEIGAGEVVLPVPAVVLAIAEVTVGHVEEGGAHGIPGQDF